MLLVIYLKEGKMKLVITALIILFSIKTEARHQKMYLQKALDQKLVKVEVKSLGGHSGFCIKMDLKNLTKDSLIIVLEAGRRLNSVDDKNQDILVTQQEIIAMKKEESRSLKVKGYCCQSGNYSPPKDATYDIHKMADSSLVKLANYLNVSKLNAGAEQMAIWSISDNQSIANVSSDKDSSLLPLRQLVANLKGEKLPWYFMITKTVVFASGSMQTYPLYLRGKLNYSNDKEDYVSLYVFDEKGMPVCEIKSQWLLPCANKDYDLNIPVKGLAKGKYSIELKTPEKQLAKQEFEI